MWLEAGGPRKLPRQRPAGVIYWGSSLQEWARKTGWAGLTIPCVRLESLTLVGVLGRLFCPSRPVRGYHTISWGSSDYWILRSIYIWILRSIYISSDKQLCTTDLMVREGWNTSSMKTGWETWECSTWRREASRRLWKEILYNENGKTLKQVVQGMCVCYLPGNVQS